MEPNDNTNNLPHSSHSRNDNLTPATTNATTKPDPPPGVVAGSLAICTAFVLFGFGGYFLSRWLQRRRAPQTPKTPPGWTRQQVHGVDRTARGEFGGAV
ncbi:hypothetical protein GCG54_00005097 [Colletotrichum gloeosporioides]|uniref:Uncharacterized protein n=1 Tax=Colletotrichum gloeosporioides TaxID=474922 RepID=A0A8H4CKT9_COLGL|nr:uncharacterized protein GCG54_00005097 [Colletotrichum gloeosporioides]KAF3805734.1 hypothetical protein GCG54_00005097 [Colletotrichum gloeosporioides]